MNIVKFFQDYGIKFYTKGKDISHGWIAIPCPFCTDTGHHLGIPLSGEYGYCWKCGGKSIEYLVRTLIDVDEYELQIILEEYDGSSTHKARKALNNNVEKINLPGGELRDIHTEYLRKRNFDPEYIQKMYKIQGTWLDNEYPYRIIIPIILEGKVVSFQARAIRKNDEPRYKMLAEEKSIISAKKTLYNIDNCKKNSIIVVEGVTDVWRLGEDSCATFGVGSTPEQVQLLRKYKNVFIVFDPERKAQDRARKLAKLVSAYGNSVEIVDTELDHDPGDMTKEEVVWLKKELNLIN